ncbi:hypothetical protein EJ06DRAFT_283258 [Trichodelitschia bisporula]|uniref:Uncharacterized protein n=1 Tax=Trichodelitschia bisporula TaxID=703511 RepID=A0A6G1I675_9PEZI|nr:hypothetical protein EJ06DRAFT_283258 [Trichodelitschia bisporula]
MSPHLHPGPIRPCPLHLFLHRPTPALFPQCTACGVQLGPPRGIVIDGTSRPGPRPRFHQRQRRTEFSLHKLPEHAGPTHTSRSDCRSLYKPPPQPFADRQAPDRRPL